MSARPRAALFGAAVDEVFEPRHHDRLAERAVMLAPVIDAGNIDEHLPRLAPLEAIVATWGMPLLSPAQLDRMPRLCAVFYAGGSIKHFARPLLERGVIVTSAWRVNAIPTAQFACAQIVLACKGYFRNSRLAPALEDRAYRWAPRGKGVYGASVAVLGCGAVGRAVVEQLRPLGVRVLAVDPYLDAHDARALGVIPVGLEQAFGEADVVSNHMPDLPETRGILGASLFERMPEGATFVNTARGAQVREDELAAVLAHRPDLTALLDVTAPEPPHAASPLRTLDGVHLSTHIAGALGRECGLMVDCALDELDAWIAGRPLRHRVTLEMLATMA